MEWIIPLQKKRFSGPDQISFLSREENEHGPIYISDNHKAALWCFAQSLNQNLNIPFSLLHIDAHYDCDDRGASVFPEDWRKLSFQELYSIKLDDGLPLIRWDNYLPLFINAEKKLINKKIALTHQIGKKINFDREIACWDIPKFLDDILISESKWILNLDLDYFFARRFKDAPLFSEEYIRYIFSLLKLAFDENRFFCVTVALSPECCGSWENSERILNLFCRDFEISNPTEIK